MAISFNVSLKTDSSAGTDLQNLSSRSLHCSCWLPILHRAFTTQMTHVKPTAETQLKARGPLCGLAIRLSNQQDVLCGSYYGVRHKKEWLGLATRHGLPCVDSIRKECKDIWIIDHFSQDVCNGLVGRELLDDLTGSAKLQLLDLPARTWLLITRVSYFNWLIVEDFCSACSRN